MASIGSKLLYASLKARSHTIPDVTITLNGDQIKNLRVVNAKINGALGGKSKSAKKAKSSRRNGKLNAVAA